MSIIYILSQGDYERNCIMLVTTDVKQVAKKYVEIINLGQYGSSFDNPYIEIWKDGCGVKYHYKEFHENNKNEKQIIKRLSKIGRELLEEQEDLKCY